MIMYFSIELKQKLMKHLFLVLFVIALSFNFSLAQSSAQWRGDNRDGYYNESGLLDTWPETGPKLLWHYDKLGAGHASAAIADGMIFTAGVDVENGFVVALSMAGNEIWKSVYGKEWMESYEGVRSTPVINDGRVYIVSGYGVVVCMEAATGKELWKVDLLTKYVGENTRWGLTENLLIVNNQLICTPGGKTANIVSLDKNTGNLLWKTAGKGDRSAYCSPQLANHQGKDIIITHTSSFILAVDAKDGQLLWSYDWPNKYAVQANTPLYADGKVFCASGYGKGSVLLKIADDNKSVETVWENSEFDNQMGGFVLIGDKLYGAGQNSRKWMCVDWNSGTTVYSFTDLRPGNIIRAEGLLYMYGQGGNVALVEPTESSFNIKGKFKVPYGEKQHWAHLVIKNKWLFVRHGSSLMVYDIAK